MADADATAQLRGLDMGTGTNFAFDPEGIGGLGVPDPKTNDSVYDGADGSFASPDFMGVRIITIPITILGSSVEDVWNGLDLLNEAWAPCRDGVDLELRLALPNGVRLLLGRPRGLVADTAMMKNSTMKALCRFDGMDPNFRAEAP